MPASTLCADCQSNDGALEIRKRRLCSGCFNRYVNSKVLKRMESYRFRNLTGDQKKRLLLPLSGGVSSLVLLHVLDTQLKKQYEMQNRTAYDLILIHIVHPDIAGSVSAEWRKKTISRFPAYSFPLPVEFHEVFQIDDRIEQDMLHLGLHRSENHNNFDFYKSIMSSTSSVTGRADLNKLFLKRMLISLAKHYGCESILWGHSNSQLAAQTLADVAKGRGGSVPGSVLDGSSASGINFNYPIGDLFRSELELYASLLPEPLELLPDSNPGPLPTIRNTSIDNLLSHYISSQGEKYPSIMANVVKTASKLQATKVDSETRLCPMCDSLIDSVNFTGKAELCYGCERIKQDIRLSR